MAQKPDPYVGKFEGQLTIDKEKIMLKSEHFVMRGAVLRNTPWIIGCIVYTGYDTKLMRNEEKGKQKVSLILQATNHKLFYICCFQITLVIILTCMKTPLFTNMIPNVPMRGFYFFTYLILLNSMIPISLIISLEFVHLFQCYFIQQDDDMARYKQLYIKRACKANVSGVNEELGQIEYIFTDKTGTLTRNEMIWKSCCIGLKSYEGSGEGEWRDDVLTLKMKGLTYSSTQSYNFTEQQLIYHFFMLLATTHECIIDNEAQGESIVYQGMSPDEITLVDAACRQGFKFLGKKQKNLQIEVLGKIQEVELLYLFPFDSDRKRMTVIVNLNGEYKLFCKGADSIIISRLSKAMDQPYLDFINSKLKEFSLIGLRTLCMSVRNLTQSEFALFQNKYNELARAEDRETKIMELAAEWEQELFLLGSTAIEDKLQDNVSECIHDCLRAGIKVWMLTGDKLETAENIARSCKLIAPDMKVFYLRDDDTESIKKTFNIFKTEWHQTIKKSVIIEGNTLRLIQSDEDLLLKFQAFMEFTNSVVCCRATPKQKAEMVKLIRVKSKKITLAIGDGANDCNMIQEANVGIGIYGNEGMRAVLTADFAIGEFQCLWKLLFVHGRQNYIRICNLVLYFFYKNMMFTCGQILFATINGFSGQAAYESFYITFYNLVFTAFPLIVTATFDWDLNYKKIKVQQNGKIDVLIHEPMLLLTPKYYYTGKLNMNFKDIKFLQYVFTGIIHACIIFAINWGSVSENGIVNSTGITTDYWLMSLQQYTSVILLADIKIAFLTKYWTIFNILVIVFLSLGLYVLYLVISDRLLFLLTNDSIMMLSNQQLYITIVLIVGIIWLLDLAFFVYNKEYNQGEVESAYKQFLLGDNVQQRFQKTIEQRYINDYNIYDEQYGKKVSFQLANSKQSVINRNSQNSHFQKIFEN